MLILMNYRYKMKKIENIMDCISGLQDMLENIDIREATLDDASQLNDWKGYNEEDRVRDIIEFLKDMRGSD